MSDDSAYSVETDEMEAVCDESPSRELSEPQIKGTRTTNLESVPSEEERKNDVKESESLLMPCITSEKQTEFPILNHELVSCEQLSESSEAMDKSECNEKRNESLYLKDVKSPRKIEAEPSNMYQSSMIESYLNMDLLDPTVRLKKK